jgi:hypothetical protein
VLWFVLGVLYERAIARRRMRRSSAAMRDAITARHHRIVIVGDDLEGKAREIAHRLSRGLH